MWAQRDAITIFGYYDSLNVGLGLTKLDFRSSQAKLEYFGPSPRTDKQYWMGTGSALSNPDGTLLLYSDGCDVREANGRLIAGTNPLVEDDYSAQCSNLAFTDGWPNEVLLPAPDAWGDSVAYMLVHKISFPGDDTTFKSLGMTALRIARRQGRYILTDRIPFGDHSAYVSMHVTAYPAPAAIGGVWCVPVVEHATNRWQVDRVAGMDDSWNEVTSTGTGPI